MHFLKPPSQQLHWVQHHSSMSLQTAPVSLQIHPDTAPAPEHPERSQLYLFTLLQSVLPWDTDLRPCSLGSAMCRQEAGKAWALWGSREFMVPAKWVCAWRWGEQMQRWLEVLSASTSSAVVTQEGAMDSPEMQQASPRQKCTLSG